MDDDPISAQDAYVIKPTGYRLESQVQSDPGAQSIVIGRRSLGLTAVTPELPSPYITGRYQAEGGEFSLLINQAGSHVMMFLVPASTPNKGPTQLIGGDFKNDRFHLFEYSQGPQGVGALVIEGGVARRIRCDSGPFQGTRSLVLNEARSTYSGRVHNSVVSGYQNPPIMLTEWAPLTRQEKARIHTTCAMGTFTSPNRLGELTKQYNAVGSGPPGWRAPRTSAASTTW